jgi:hypothetical protein
MDLSKTFATNADAENNGVWYDLDATSRVRVARDGNPRHQRVLREITAPYRVQIARNTIDPDVVARLNIEAMARAVLLDWAGIEDEGQPVPYSQDAAKALLTKYPEFRKTIKSLSEDMALFAAAHEEAAAGN